MTSTHTLSRNVRIYSILFASGLGACSVTSHPVTTAELGEPTDLAALEASLDRPGPVVFERVVAADWEVPRSGLLDLDHPRAEAARLEDRSEPIQIYFYVLRHPSRGTFLVDSGVQSGLRDPDRAIASGLLASQMSIEAMKVHLDTAAWLAKEPAPPAGVLLTHLHLDHVLGLPDLPPRSEIYVGPGESSARQFMNLFVQGTIDRALEGKRVRELARPANGSDAVWDLFGDGSVFALHVPGHTPGSLAFVVRTPEGPVLLVGDTSHTAWGWQHDVPPGTYTADHEANQRSLELLRGLATRHPNMKVHLGHQALPTQGSDPEPAGG